MAQRLVRVLIDQQAGGDQMLSYQVGDRLGQASQLTPDLWIQVPRIEPLRQGRLIRSVDPSLGALTGAIPATGYGPLMCPVPPARVRPLIATAATRIRRSPSRCGAARIAAAPGCISSARR